MARPVFKRGWMQCRVPHRESTMLSPGCTVAVFCIAEAKWNRRLVQFWPECCWISFLTLSFHFHSAQYYTYIYFCGNTLPRHTEKPLKKTLKGKVPKKKSVKSLVFCQTGHLRPSLLVSVLSRPPSNKLKSPSNLMVAFSGANSYSGSPNGEWDDVQHFLFED